MNLIGKCGEGHLANRYRNEVPVMVMILLSATAHTGEPWITGHLDKLLC
jgi:hypothetical protein